MKIIIRIGKKRYFERYIKLIQKEYPEESRSMIINEIKKAAAKSGGNFSQQEKERTIIETLKADLKGNENTIARDAGLALIVSVISLVYNTFDIKIAFKGCIAWIITFALFGAIISLIIRLSRAYKEGFLLSILEDWKYDDPNEKENGKTVNLNIVCKIKRK